MEFVFDKIDEKLISYLYHHHREPLTKISKACRVSRDQVEYRLKKYEKKEIIKKYATIFNYRLLGYDEFIVIWFKLNASEEQKKQIRDDFNKNQNIITYLDVIGKYDLVADLIYKNKEEFQREFSEYLQRHKSIIKDYSVFIATSTSFFPLKEFGLSLPEKEFVLENSKDRISLDDSEIKILNSLEKNGRAKIVDIAAEADISAELALYKLKQLYKKKIILGTRVIFDLEKMNYFFGSLRLKINALNDRLKKELVEYCKQHKYINAVSFGIGEYNCLIQVFYKEEKRFRKSLKEILNRFREDIQESDVILIENEGDVKTLPVK